MYLGNFIIKWEDPVVVLTKKQSAKNSRSQQSSDLCYSKEGHRSILNREPESALLVFSGIIISCPHRPLSFSPFLSFVKYSSWIGNSTKIRPPPMS